jgi:signal transduction histidine kinase
MDIFNEDYVEFQSESPEIISKLTAHWFELLLILPKNAIQSIPEQQELKKSKIKKEDNNVPITVSDNGIGIQARMHRIWNQIYHQK